VIVGIGTDVVSIERIAGVLARHGERFVNRVLTADERARYERTNEKARPGHLAKRWAAKEAFAKAIGTGIHPPFTWQSITVGRDSKGKPLVIPNETMAEHLRSIGVTTAHITLTDDAGIAVAFVVLENLAPRVSDPAGASQPRRLEPLP
jgi:holo-[acyl-carrier protein] synthase